MKDITQATIVMIEDNTMHRQMYRMQFNRAGFERFYAYQTAQEGMKQIIEKKPDLIILDIALQEMDGIEVLRRIKDDKETADIPVIMLSNMRKQDRGKEALELGALDYYVKAEHLPYEVVEKVKKILLEGN